MQYTFLDKFNKNLEEDTFLSKYIKEFYYYSIRNYKDKLDKRTIYIIMRNIEGFEKFIHYQFPYIISLDEINEKHLAAFKDFCIYGLKNAKKTINSKLTSLRYFFNFLSEKGFIKYNIALNIKKFKITENEIPTHFNSSDLKILFSEMRKIQYGIRDIAICKIILTTGLEIVDVLNLKLEQLDIDTKSLIIENKIYPLGDSLLIELKDYLVLRNYIDFYNSEYVFLSRRGTPYSIRSFQLLFKKALTNTGIPVELSPRFLRSTFLYNMAKVIKENELREIANQEKLSHYYKLLKNPLQNII